MEARRPAAPLRCITSEYKVACLEWLVAWEAGLSFASSLERDDSLGRFNIVSQRGQGILHRDHMKALRFEERNCSGPTRSICPGAVNQDDVFGPCGEFARANPLMLSPDDRISNIDAIKVTRYICETLISISSLTDCHD